MVTPLTATPIKFLTSPIPPIKNLFNFCIEPNTLHKIKLLVDMKQCSKLNKKIVSPMEEFTMDWAKAE